MSDRVIVSSIPPCDICGDGKTPAVIDGKTVHGPWAYMCKRHWTTEGIGRLGTGYGQRLLLADAPTTRVGGAS